jgi:hypothetical protein
MVHLLQSEPTVPERTGFFFGPAGPRPASLPENFTIIGRVLKDVGWARSIGRDGLPFFQLFLLCAPP